MLWAIFYLSLGVYQKNEAIKVSTKIAKDRGHDVIRIMLNQVLEIYYYGSLYMRLKINFM